MTISRDMANGWKAHEPMGMIGTYRQHNAATRAQTEASRPDVSVWVSANAGSGKTRVLTNRVARLLLAGAEPSRILCLTYTKAAASEMQNRLFKTLGDWSMASDARLSGEIERLLAEDEPPLLPADQDAARRLFARALETPGGLKIQTIHAFCESLLSRFPLEAQVSPHFQVVDEETTKTLLAEAQDRVVSSRTENPDLATAFELLLRDLPEASFSEMIAEIAGKRNVFGAADDDHDARLATAIGAALGDRRDTLLEDWSSKINRVHIERLAEAHRDAVGKQDQRRAVAFAAAAEAETAEAAFQALASAVLTKDGAPPQRGFPSKAIEERHPWCLEPIAQLQRGLMDLRPALLAADRLSASSALAHFAKSILREYDRAKAERAGVDYDDLINKAVGLLTRSDARDWIRFKLDGGIEHILVDEAQDTSPPQWRAIAALAEDFFAGAGAYEDARDESGGTPRTIFAVGDEKQSIYSFQGAAPELLSEMGARFAASASGLQDDEATPGCSSHPHGPPPVARAFRRSGLATSFRSTPAILQFVDQVFASEQAAKGLVFDAGAVRHTAFRENQSGLVELWPLLEAAPDGEPPAWHDPIDTPPPDDPKRRLADLIAQTIQSWIGREQLPARGRAMRAGDILILVRSRGPLSVGLIKRLKQLDVPVSGEDRLLLNAQLAVKDFLALARFCLFPEDDLTLATLLRSPFCEIDEQALFDLAHPRRPGQPLWYALSNRREERPDFSQAHGFLAQLVQQADFLRPFELFALALGPLGARPRFVARLGPEAEDPIDELLAQALAFETSGAPTLQSFVEWMTARQSEIKREHEQGRDEVRVMTAHGAKGLEAPVVILPDTTGKPSGGHNPKLLDPRQPGTPPIWVAGAKTDPPLVEAIRDAHIAREEEEHRRLLYVALTRAEDRLLICGAAKRTPPAGCWYALCAAAMTGDGADLAEIDGAALSLGAPYDSPVLNAQGRPLTGWRLVGAGDQIVEDAHGSEAPAAPEAPPWLRQPAPRETAAVELSPSRLGGEDPERAADQSYDRSKTTPLAAEAAKRRGVAIHALLERLPAAAPEDRDALAERVIDRLAPEFDASMRAGMRAEASAVIEDPAFAPLFGPGSQAETPIGAVLPELGVESKALGEMHGLIDRLVVTPERVLIVDYKTGAIPDAPPEAYLRQLAAYRVALQHLFPDRPVEAALLWTAAPRLDHIDATALDAALARAAADLDRR